MQKNDSKIIMSVIIPMYNESSIIKDTASTLYKYMTETFGKGNFEILFSKLRASVFDG